MLRLSIHAGDSLAAKYSNRLAWMDIGYHTVKAYANYKTCLFQNGIGCSPTTLLTDYPRWSASVWDLVARAICLNLQLVAQPEVTPKEEMPPTLRGSAKIAFAEHLSARLEHISSARSQQVRLLSRMDIQMRKPKGTYEVLIREDGLENPIHHVFTYKPSILQPALLVAKAACQYLHKDCLSLPPRPKLMLPPVISDSKGTWLPIQTIAEPTKTGFERWLAAVSYTPIQHGEYGSVVEADIYAAFLERAI